MTTMTQTQHQTQPAAHAGPSWKCDCGGAHPLTVRRCPADAARVTLLHRAATVDGGDVLAAVLTPTEG